MKLPESFSVQCVEPKRLQAPSASIGLLWGMGAYVACGSETSRYLLDDSLTCTNWHLWAPQRTMWMYSRRARLAGCNAYHVPCSSVVSKYPFKARAAIQPYLGAARTRERKEAAAQKQVRAPGAKS